MKPIVAVRPRSPLVGEPFSPQPSRLPLSAIVAGGSNEQSFPPQPTVLQLPTRICRLPINTLVADGTPERSSIAQPTVLPLPPRLFTNPIPVNLVYGGSFDPLPPTQPTVLGILTQRPRSLPIGVMVAGGNFEQLLQQPIVLSNPFRPATPQIPGDGILIFVGTLMVTMSMTNRLMVTSRISATQKVTTLL